MKSVFALTAALALALAGCSGTPQAPPPASDTPQVLSQAAPPTSTYYPLKVGNKWVFSGRDYAPSRRAGFLALAPERQMAPKGTYVSTDQVLGTTVYHGLTWLKVRESADGDSYNFWCRHDVVGLAAREVAPASTGRTEYAIKAPLKVGTAWQARDGSLKIISTTATVQVPAGKFTNCVAVQGKYPDAETVVWYYHAGVGPIQMKDTISGVLSGRLDLKSYTIK